MTTKIQVHDTSPSAVKDFSDYQLVLLFFQKIDAQGVSEISAVSKTLNVSATGEADFDQSNLQIEGNIQINLKGPSGNILATKEIATNLFIGQTSMELDYAFSQLTLDIPATPSANIVNGKLLDSTGKMKLEEIQIIIYAASISTPDQFLPIQSTTTESEGYFLLSYPSDNYNSAYALLGISSTTGKNKIAINFDKDANGKNIFPQRLILVLEPDDTSTALPETNSDCGCTEFNLHDQKRILDEFSYYSLIRTSDPEIKAYSVSEEEDISLDQLLRASPTSSNPIVTGIITDPVNIFGHPKLSGILMSPEHNVAAVTAPAQPQPVTTRSVSTQPVATQPPISPVVLTEDNISEQLKNIQIKKSVVRDFLDQYKVLNKDTYSSLLQLNDAAKIGDLVNNASPLPLGRTNLSSGNQIDWDNKPTIYQATSIAYGHLLHYKQQWVADGYSLGDLVYSLPLAPGQKKQIVTFDWERRESASNSQEIDYEESLDNSLSRDRDINEITSGVVNEKLNGSSTSTVKSASAGLGATIGPLVLGASGGISKSNSSASQDSMREMAASDSQYLSDKTVQSANAVRSQRSTVIQTVAQGEKYEVSAESVANYNHCHALTIQYFEVLRHFKVQQRLVDAQECLFIPLPISTFDIDKARRWQEILFATLRDRSLLKGFDALQRVKDRWEHSDLPTTTFAAENVLSISGTLKIKIDLTCPADKLTPKTRQVTYTAPGGRTYTDTEDYTVSDYDSNQWDWVATLLGMNSYDFYMTYIKDQTNRDDIFRKLLGDKIAQKIINNLTFKAVDENNNNLPVTIDASLSSTFHDGVPLSVSIKSGITAIPREKFVYLKIGITPGLSLPASCNMLVVSGSTNYRTQHKSNSLFKYSSINDDLATNDEVQIYCGPTHEELRNPKEDDVELVNKLLYHLNANLEFYHKMIWLYITPERRFMLLDGINIYVEDEQRIRSVASVVNNKLIGIVGNSMVFQVVPGLNLNPDFKQGIANEKTGELVPLIDYYQHEPLDPLRISVPTKGVFAEAMMGQCNSCEIKDEKRFWRWEESPIPDRPTAISPIVTPTPTVTQPNLQTNPLASPVVNIQNAPNVPDPQGMAAALNLLGKGDTFRDITGLAANQSNALAGLQSSLNTTSTFGQMGLDLRKAIMQNNLDQQKLQADQAEQNMRQTKLAAITDLYNRGKINKDDFDNYILNEGMNPALKNIKDANQSEKQGDITENQKNILTASQTDQDVAKAQKISDWIQQQVQKGNMSATAGSELTKQLGQMAVNPGSFMPYGSDQISNLAKGIGDGNISNFKMGSDGSLELAAYPQSSPFTTGDSMRLDNVSKFLDLLLFKVPDDIVSYLSSRNMQVQYAHNESFSNDLNTDLYTIQIDQFPTLGDTLLNAQTLAEHIRKVLLFNLPISLAIPPITGSAPIGGSMFQIYDSAIDEPMWDNASPTKAVIKIAIPPDNASVVVSNFSNTGPYSFYFTTINAPLTGRHPVSGTRAFGVAESPSAKGIYHFFIKGVDMISTGVAGLGLPGASEWGYEQADLLWKSLQDNVIDFINSNGGSAKKSLVYSERVEWKYVYNRYQGSLESVFGVGAGSPQNSPFITW